MDHKERMSIEADAHALRGEVGIANNRLLELGRASPLIVAINGYRSRQAQDPQQFGRRSKRLSFLVVHALNDAGDRLCLVLVATENAHNVTFQHMNPSASDGAI